MNPIGGELAVKPNDFDLYFTDSGRSSLRLFLRSGDNRNKKYLLPNFLCDIIEKVFIDENIDYQFYNVFEDLSIDVDFINNLQYDILYVINYFGKYINLSQINLTDKILIEDNVFFEDFTNHNNVKNWYSFNSFRKISNLSDGSMVKTNLFIDESLIIKSKSPFSILKQEAKNIKYNYLNNHKFKEEDYLSKFDEGESILNKQENIYSMSNKSIYLLFLNENNQNIRKERFAILYKIFKKYSILEDVEFYSFFVMKLDKRDDFRKKLMGKSIFLPVHWPKYKIENSLYDSIISIPLFENYSDEEFDFMIKKMREVL